MKLTLMIPLLVLAGYASNAPAKEAAAAQSLPVLPLTWLQPDSMQVTLDGKRFEGKGTTSRCNPFTCPDAYGRVAKSHRHHLRKGEAELKSADGGRLACEWVSHLPAVEGTCLAQDGRAFRLVEARPAH